MSLKQYNKMSKTALMRKITKTLRAMPKAKLAMLCYNLTKLALHRIDPTATTATPRRTTLMIGREYKKLRASQRKTKRKFSAKQLAAQRLFAKRAKAGTLRRRR